MIGGSGSSLVYSTDGWNWEYIFPVSETHMTMVTALFRIPSSGRWLLGGSGYRASSDRVFLYYSDDDGETWTECPSYVTGFTDTVQDFATDGETIVAARLKGIVFTSTNGTHWTKRTLYNPDSPLAAPDLQSIAYGNGIWVICGSATGADLDSTRMYYSYDGITWTYNQAMESLNSTLWDVFFDGEMFMAAGSTDGWGYGSIFSSYDGITWTQENVGIHYESNGKYYAVCKRNS